MSVSYLALITFGATGVVCFSFCFCAVLDEYVICLTADEMGTLIPQIAYDSL